MRSGFDRRAGGGLGQDAIDNRGVGVPGKQTLTGQLAGYLDQQHANLPGKGTLSGGAVPWGAGSETMGARALAAGFGNQSPAPDEPLMCLPGDPIATGLPAMSLRDSGSPAEAAPGVQAPAAAAAEPAKQEPEWSVHARRYNREHAALSEQFLRATHNACVGADGEIDPGAVAHWQVAHGVQPDGRVGPRTVQAAMGEVEASTSAAPTLAAPVPAAAELAPAPPGSGPAPQGPKAGVAAPPKLERGEPIRYVLDGGGGKVFQKCLVFVSPGGLSSNTPDIYMHFHGYQAQYHIDPKQKRARGGASGSDTAALAMSHAKGKNLVAILPQGNVGRGEERGGHMTALHEVGLPTFLQSVLDELAHELGMESLSPGRISISGHSAGGYEGVHSAMSKAGGLMDHITDLTLMDSSYSVKHFEDAADWIFSGSSGKNLRIIGQRKMLHGKYAVKRGHAGVLGEAALEKRAAAEGFELEHLPEGDKRDTATVIQHSRLKKDGQIHADVLVLESKHGHEQIRDDVMDDAMLSIGQGAKGNDQFDHLDRGKLPSQASAVSPSPDPAAPAEHDHDDGDTEASDPQKSSGHDQGAVAGAGNGHRAKEPKSARPVEPEHVHDVLKTVMPHDGGKGDAPHPKEPADSDYDPDDGLINKHLKAKAPEPHDVGKADTASSDWLHDQHDVVSVLQPEVKAAYEKCLSLSQKKKLSYPGWETKGQTSWPYVRFVELFYKQFQAHERRINKEIRAKGGRDPLQIAGYLRDLCEPVPAAYCAKPNQRIHHKALAAFLTMREAAEKDGVPLLVLSGWRPPKSGKSKNSYAKAGSWSSHSFGLAIDFQLSVSGEHTVDHKKFSVHETNTYKIENLLKYYGSPVVKWLATNAGAFDFHPFMLEPWHYEYAPEGMAEEIIAGERALKRR